MLKKISLFASSVMGATVLSVSTKASAAIQPGGGISTEASSFENIVNSALNYALGAAALIAAIYIIIAGFSYITSSGNAEKVQSATKTITYAIIGLIIVAISFALKAFVMQKLGITGAQSL